MHKEMEHIYAYNMHHFYKMYDSYVNGFKNNLYAMIFFTVIANKFLI